jgi:hypothetical protein
MVICFFSFFFCVIYRYGKKGVFVKDVTCREEGEVNVNELSEIFLKGEYFFFFRIVRI